MKKQTSHSAAKLLAAITLVFLGAGCTKYLDFEGENAKPRLVMNGLMQPDSIFNVSLSNSLGFVDIGNIAPLTNARVAVHDANDNLVDSLFHTGEGMYVGSMAPTVGQAYTIRARAGAFPDAFATDAIPQPVPIASWDTLTTAATGGWDFGGDDFNIFFNIDDPAGEENFYLLQIFSVGAYYLDYVYDPNTNTWIADTIYLDNPQRFNVSFVTSDQVFMSENDIFAGDVNLYSSRLLFSDRLFNGSNRRFSLKLEYFNPTPRLEISLTSCSRDYFRYVRTIQRYDWTEGDPFAEPVQVFTNMQGGGLGIWGGASESTVTINF